MIDDVVGNCGWLTAADLEWVNADRIVTKTGGFQSSFWIPPSAAVIKVLIFFLMRVWLFKGRAGRGGNLPMLRTDAAITLAACYWWFRWHYIFSTMRFILARSASISNSSPLCKCRIRQRGAHLTTNQTKSSSTYRKRSHLISIAHPMPL